MGVFGAWACCGESLLEGGIPGGLSFDLSSVVRWFEHKAHPRELLGAGDYLIRDWPIRACLRPQSSVSNRQSSIKSGTKFLGGLVFPSFSSST